MKLWYVNIWLDYETGYDDDYRYEFLLHTRFISNFLSKQMRKKKNWFETDFNMISVNAEPEKLEECKMLGDILSVDVPFNQEKYEKIKNTPNVDYYLELFEKGFKKAAKFKNFPLSTLLQLINDFRNNDYKNEWLHKKKRFKEYDIEVLLNCYFTTFDFKLVATINKISTKKTLCSGTVLKTEPDEICFDFEFKDVFIFDGKIIITDRFDLDRILINLKDALNSKFNSKLLKRKL